MIDPKPFFGDPCYDATQHLMNRRARMRKNPLGLVERMSSLLEVDERRVRRWTFARFAVDHGDGAAASAEIAARLAD